MQALDDNSPRGERLLRRLQERVSPRPDYGSSETTSHYISDVCSGGLRKNPNFRRYIELVLEDENIATLARAHSLSVGRFERLFRMLVSAGLDRWRGGRNLALSVLGDYHSLLFVMACIKRNRSLEEVADILEEYLDGEVTTHQLIKVLNREDRGRA